MGGRVLCCSSARYEGRNFALCGFVKVFYGNVWSVREPSQQKRLSRMMVMIIMMYTAGKKDSPRNEPVMSVENGMSG